jgi:type I restriction-modification system DNA methylase subunit
MLSQEQKKAARKFSEEWKGKGYEKGESQKFWIDLLCNVYGVQDFSNFISFEEQVKLDHTSFIDGYIDSSKVLIEQKSIDKDLKAPIKQSDGSFLNPFQQAKRYITELPVSKHPRWVVTCNFKSFLVYDMENPNGEPEEILLENLEKEYYRLSFITETGSVHLKKELEISKKAGDIIGEIYDAILKQYKDAANPSPATLKSLNMLCVRIVFCLYAEDAGIFGHKSMFGDYLKQFEAKDLRRALLDLFAVLDQKEEERDEYLEESLAAFPYVNGGLFTEEDKTIPPITEEIKDLLVKHASSEFDWSEISPTIFGAIFESTLNPETRRSGGMHYTSIENIHKVIDPLFLDDLKAELEEIKQIKTAKTRIEKVKAFHEKLGTLKFLDPACGSGNFLTETFISLRKLGNECIRLEIGDQNQMAFDDDFVKVSIHQFYGIEINDFAVSVAKTALWIAECQMLEETSRIVGKNLNFLPLKSYANIIQGNALRIDWESVVPKNELNYIMGNPPFVGGMMMSTEQKKEITEIYENTKGIGEADYVSAWYAKAAKLMNTNKNIKASFVSTNSITQGEQPSIVWKYLFEKYKVKIDFAYRTFRWDSEANLKAHVHCVIIGFSCTDSKKAKTIYLNESQSITAMNINGYLLDAPNIFISNRSAPMCSVPPMVFGNMPRDGGGFILSEDEKNDLIKKEPLAEKWIHFFPGAEEFINNKKRYCLWLVGANPSEIKKCPTVMARVESVRAMRASSKAASTRKMADTPTLFAQITQPLGKPFVIVPSVSSEKRRYIPIGFMDGETVASNLVFVIPEATLYHFGILTSNVHMSWMRAVAGRLEMRYRYSKDIVYNNFPWCTPHRRAESQNRKDRAGNS